MKKTSKLLGIILITAVIGILIACNDEDPKPNPPETCTDAAGTIHLLGETPSCKGKEGCACEFDVPGTRASNGIAITNRGGNVANFVTLSTEISDMLANAPALAGAKGTYIKNTIKEIAIVNGTGGVPTITNGVVTIKSGHTMGEIVAFFTTYTSAITMFKQMDNSKVYA